MYAGLWFAAALIIMTAKAQSYYASSFFHCSEQAVEGSIVFSQDAPGSPTKVKVQLKTCDGKASTGHSYHVHTRPWTGASFDEAGGHFDPEGVEVDGYVCNPLNHSTCYAGDLSGKHGKLSLNGTESDVEYIDETISMEENHAILGRSVVIHAKEGGSERVACSSIGSTTVAKFRGDVKGLVTFSYTGGAFSYTRVFLDNGEKSSGHMLHIHEDPVTGDCSSAGKHYDPTDVENKTNYECNPNDISTCYKGDLSGKHGRVTMGEEMEYLDDHNDNIATLGRSVVIHAADGGSERIGCATIGVTFIAEMVGPNGEDYGSLEVSQSMATYPLWFRIFPKGNTSGHMYHIHEHAVVGNDCSTALGHYDPERKESFSNYSCNGRNVEQNCSLGDLSGKHGQMDLSVHSTYYTDTQIKHIRDLYDKSIVLHAADGGKERIACGTLRRAVMATPSPTPGPTIATSEPTKPSNTLSPTTSSKDELDVPMIIGAAVGGVAGLAAIAFAITARKRTLLRRRLAETEKARAGVELGGGGKFRF